MLLEYLEQKVMLFVHTSLRHLVSDKCNAEIKNTFHFRGLSRNLTKLIASCDICQRTIHMNRLYDIAERHHLRQGPGEQYAVDLYGN